MAHLTIEELSSKIDRFLSNAPQDLLALSMERSKRLKRNQRIYNHADHCLHLVEAALAEALGRRNAHSEIDRIGMRSAAFEV